MVGERGVMAKIAAIKVQEQENTRAAEAMLADGTTRLQSGVKAMQAGIKQKQAGNKAQTRENNAYVKDFYYG